VGAVIAQANDYSFAQLSGKPTTLAGYGITNGVISTDPRLSDDRTADSIRTLTKKGISAAADPGQGDLLVYSAGSWKPAHPDTFQGPAVTMPSTTSLAGVMMGLQGTLTPNFSNRCMATCCGQVKNTVAGNGAEIKLRHGGGTKPSNGDALTGSVVGSIVGFSGANYGANMWIPFSVTALITTAAIGVAHWFDISLAAVVGGTVQVTNVAITAYEF
jgi:hypothetical protein